MTGRRIRAALLTLGLLAVAGPAAVNAANPDFPGADPDEGVRIHTPDDPEFDRCEPDDEDGTQECTNVFGQEWQRFGFAPAGSQATATYKNDGCGAAVSAATLDLCGDPHTRRLIEQNLKAGRAGPGQVSGVSVDRAWKRSVGDPSVQIAILDTGIRWDRAELRAQVALNRGELPLPRKADGSDCAAYDCDGDGAFNVDDYTGDSRVAQDAGHEEADDILDASDLIAAFSSGSHPGGIEGGADDDANGYADDIAGWDFFDGDNDPYDASSYSSAGNHGSGRAEEAAGKTNNAAGGTGLCPRCQIVPMRIWDTFVVDTNFFAQGVAYAADNGVEVVEGAIGGLTNSRFSRRTFEEAYEQGVFFAIVSSDLNTSSHNFPTTYDEAMMVNGTVADVNGLGIEIPGVSDTLLPGLNQLLGGLAGVPGVGDALGLAGGAVPLGTNIPIGTWFRNSGTTQYGEHAHIAMPGTTGSEATGQAAGAAGLVASLARARLAADDGIPGPDQLEPNEIKQILTMSAEDVLPENTDAAAGATGLVAASPPDPAQEGWDRHFGYGRPDLGLALEQVAKGAIPPQAMITSPDWFAPFNVERQDAIAIGGRMAALRAAGGEYDWRLEWAPGAEPAESEFTAARAIAQGHGSGEVKGQLGTLNLETVRAALDERRTACTTVALPPVTGGDVQLEGGAPCDPTAPGLDGANPNEPAFTVRLVVSDAAGNRGEDRKVMFAYREPDEHPGWSRPIGRAQDAAGAADSGGEASQRMYDLDGDNRLEVVEATSSGELYVFRADGTPSTAFNGGKPVLTQLYSGIQIGAPFYDSVEPPREALRTPAIGDIDGDREPEIVDTAGERLYAWEADGAPVAGFPQRIDPAFSLPAERSRENHVKPGFMGSPVLADIDDDGALEIFAAALDQHLYGWRGDGGDVPGFPVYLRERDSNGEPLPCSAEVECAESINTPAVGDIDGDDKPEIVIATNEFADAPGAPPAPGAGDLTGLLGALVSNLTAGALGGEGRVYAVSSQGKILPGWPVKPGGTLPDALPLIGPGHDFVLGNADGDPESEAIGAVTTGELSAWNADGSSAATYPSLPALGETPLVVKAMNFFEYPIVADFAATPGAEVAKAGVSLTGLLNLGVLTGLNLPHNHLLQAWSHTAEGNPVAVPAYPQAIEDYQLLSSPAAADVAASDGVEILAGTGLYHIRSFNSLGEEAEGWPKFTGGWNFAVPTTGDADADGMLEVSVLTREGFSFMWDTQRPACAEDGGDNRQWWTSRHDEWNTGDYATDSRPPGAPEGLTASRRRDGGVDISWTAPGDDWLCGTAASFQVLAGRDPITRPGSGRVVKEVTDELAAAGERQTISLSEAQAARSDEFAVLYRDDAKNWGWLARADARALPFDTRLDTPLLASTRTRNGKRVPLRIKTTGIANVDHLVVQYRRTGRGTSKRYRNWRPKLNAATKRVRFGRGKLGRTYLFRIRAVGKTGAESGWRYKRLVFPYDDRGKGRRYSRGWKRSKARRAWRGGYSRTSRRGATMTFRTRGGGRVYLIARTSRKGGRAVVQAAGGKKQTVSFRSKKTRFRRVVAIANRTDKRNLRFRLRVLRGTVTVDGIAVRRR